MYARRGTAISRVGKGKKYWFNFSASIISMGLAFTVVVNKLVKVVGFVYSQHPLDVFFRAFASGYETTSAQLVLKGSAPSSSRKLTLLGVGEASQTPGKLEKVYKVLTTAQEDIVRLSVADKSYGDSAFRRHIGAPFEAALEFQRRKFQKIVDGEKLSREKGRISSEDWLVKAVVTGEDFWRTRALGKVESFEGLLDPREGLKNMAKPWRAMDRMFRMAYSINKSGWATNIELKSREYVLGVPTAICSTLLVNANRLGRYWGAFTAAVSWECFGSEFTTRSGVLTRSILAVLFVYREITDFCVERTKEIYNFLHRGIFFPVITGAALGLHEAMVQEHPALARSLQGDRPLVPEELNKEAGFLQTVKKCYEVVRKYQQKYDPAFAAKEEDGSEKDRGKVMDESYVRISASKRFLEGRLAFFAICKKGGDIGEWVKNFSLFARTSMLTFQNIMAKVSFVVAKGSAKKFISCGPTQLLMKSVMGPTASEELEGLLLDAMGSKVGLREVRIFTERTVLTGEERLEELEKIGKRAIAIVNEFVKTRKDDEHVVAEQVAEIELGALFELEETIDGALITIKDEGDLARVIDEAMRQFIVKMKIVKMKEVEAEQLKYMVELSELIKKEVEILIVIDKKRRVMKKKYHTGVAGLLEKAIKEHRNAIRLAEESVAMSEQHYLGVVEEPMAAGSVTETIDKFIEKRRHEIGKEYPAQVESDKQVIKETRQRVLKAQLDRVEKIEQMAKAALSTESGELVQITKQEAEEALKSTKKAKIMLEESIMIEPSSSVEAWRNTTRKMRETNESLGHLEWIFSYRLVAEKEVTKINRVTFAEVAELEKKVAAEFKRQTVTRELLVAHDSTLSNLPSKDKKKIGIDLDDDLLKMAEETRKMIDVFLAEREARIPDLRMLMFKKEQEMLSDLEGRLQGVGIKAGQQDVSEPLEQKAKQLMEQFTVRNRAMMNAMCLELTKLETLIELEKKIISFMTEKGVAAEKIASVETELSRHVAEYEKIVKVDEKATIEEKKQGILEKLEIGPPLEVLLVETKVGEATPLSQKPLSDRVGDQLGLIKKRLEKINQELFGLAGVGDAVVDHARQVVYSPNQ